MKLWLAVPVLAASVAVAGCDIVTADLRAEETAQWHKTYQMDPKGRVEISNVNGKIQVEPSTGNTVEVEATKKARGASTEAAKAALERITIAEDVSGGRIKVETKVQRTSGFSFSSGASVEYHVKVRAVTGQLDASTTNDGLDIDLLRMPEGGVKLECTNGGIKVRLPRDAKATISASITNGGIETDNLTIDATGENTRRRLEGRMNGGGPRLEAEGVN